MPEPTTTIRVTVKTRNLVKARASKLGFKMQSFLEYLIWIGLRGFRPSKNAPFKFIPLMDGEVEKMSKPRNTRMQ